MNHEQSSEFKNDLRKLLKKFPTLLDDLKVAQKSAIELRHVHDIDNQSIVEIPGHHHERVKFYKLRKFACKSLKGKGIRSGIRIIYAYHLELDKAIYLEIYFKGKKINGNYTRIEKYLDKL